jgi:soluble lytic murein transglycosylase-like protein
MDSRRALAAKFAAKYNLTTELVCAVIEQESDWNPWAYRYEPAFYDRYIIPLGLSEQAGRFRATSWGLMQIMGQVAREFGFLGPFFSELCNPDTGVDFGCKKLARCMFLAKGDETQALLKWNGGGAADYPKQVLARKDKYK